MTRSQKKLWQKSQCLYHMQTPAATAASSGMIYVPALSPKVSTMVTS